MCCILRFLFASSLLIAVIALPAFTSAVEVDNVDARTFLDASKPPLCPSSATVSPTRDIDGRESKWVQSRSSITRPALEAFLGVPEASLRGELPTLGVAFSGGGYRALTSAVGRLMGFTTPSADAPGVEHLWDAMTYAAGVSGGGWFLSSFYALDESIKHYEEDLVIRLQNSLWEMPNTECTFPDIVAHWAKLHYDGIVPTSINNIWGPIVASHFLEWDPSRPSVDPWIDPLLDAKGLHDRMSVQIANHIADFHLPFPILMALQVDEGVKPREINPLFEFTPFSTGCITPQHAGYIPTECFNTAFDAGRIPANATPVQGDSLPLIMGTIGSGPLALTNRGLLNYTCYDLCGNLRCHGLCPWLERQLNDSLTDRAFPSQFANFLRGTGVQGALNSVQVMQLIDAGVDMNIPFQPLMERNVEFIFAIDAGQPFTGGGPLGSPLISAQAYARHYNLPYPNIPKVYNSTVFKYTLPKELQGRQIIFGASNASAPTIIYMPLAANASLTPNNPSFDPFFPTSKTKYTKSELHEASRLSMGLTQLPELVAAIRCLVGKASGIPSECTCPPHICIN